jgi:putative Holliday junction resolvase
MPVELWDERYTTVEATQRLIQSRRRRPRDRGQLDAAAAAIILQDYVDAHRSPRASDMRMTQDGIHPTEYE